MATPTEFFVPPPTAEDLFERLEETANRQKAATPEITFEDEVEECYEWLCEEERPKFEPNEIDELRIGITEASYWECEARHLRDRLSELIWQNLLRDNLMDGVSATDGWRDVVMAYRRRLRRHGLSMQQVRESRISIKTQSYWKPEAELLRGISARREHDMQEQYWERKANIQGIPSPADSEMQHQYPETESRRHHQTPTKQPTRRSRRSQPNVGRPRANRVSGKRRSGLRSSTTSKAEKRRGKVGANARRP